MKDIVPGIALLKAKDPLLSGVIEAKGAFTLKPSADYFKDLISTIIAQQLSWKVYSVIEKRLFDKLSHSFSPEDVIALPDEEYRSCGISGSKTSYIKNVANHFKENPEFFRNINKYSDEEIIKGLTGIKGIGVWSAQMFLIFNLRRLNVFPLKDGGIRGAMKKLYKFKKEPTDKQLNKIAAKWGDYKTIATWYLWKYLEQK
jgi:DNA-3-methyladenine glycosylase II